MIGDVHPRISPGDNGLAWGTVIDGNPCLSFSSLEAVCKDATNCIVLTNTILGGGTPKASRNYVQLIPNKHWSSFSFVGII